MNSTNELAEKYLGKRSIIKGSIIVDYPCELGYKCPVCEYKPSTDGNYDMRLEWSEYNGMIRCRVCDKDYPSCFCKEDIDDRIETFIAQVQDFQTQHFINKKS